MATDTDLSDSLDSLRYLIATPGTFTAAYPNTTDDMLLQVMMDGFAEAQLERIIPATYTMDEDGIVTPALTGGQIALVAIFASVRFLRVAFLNLNTAVTYKAGSAEYHTEQSGALLRDILADLRAQKDRLIAAAEGGTGSNAGNVAFFMADQYLARVCSGPLAVGW
jgi:hypothetical protein